MSEVGFHSGQRLPRTMAARHTPEGDPTASTGTGSLAASELTASQLMTLITHHLEQAEASYARRENQLHQGIASTIQELTASLTERLQRLESRFLGPEKHHTTNPWSRILRDLQVCDSNHRHSTVQLLGHLTYHSSTSSLTLTIGLRLKRRKPWPPI